ncbi:MAG: hypothetical protein AAF518_19995 [Spirochaetota bacterium]
MFGKSSKVVIGFTLFFVINCGPIAMIGSTKEKRILDREFLELKNIPSYPKGKAKANFLLNNSGNIDTYRESGLVVSFRIEKKHYKRQIDSCDKVTLGNSLLEDPKTELAAARCDDHLYKMVLHTNVLKLLKDTEQIHDWQLPKEEAETWSIQGWRDFQQFGNLSRQ